MSNTIGLVESLLLHGRRNAVSTRTLLARTHFRSVRDLRHQIAREREGGALILSSKAAGGGYFLPDLGAAGRDELVACYTQGRRQAISALKSLRCIRRALQECTGQERL
jgi:hypothetical protein